MGNDAGPKLESAAMSTANMSNSPPSTDPDVAAPQGDDTEASTITVNTKTPTANFPPPKTDKPRPHGCTTCGRAFARLEHLKRHERSHTKEKPFECPECKRCFARRDLLLRHQQKLHQSTAPSARPRNRRESASGVTIGQSRARKNSVAGPVQSAPPNPASMRPRANTISVVDSAAIQMMTGAANGPVGRMPPTHSRHDSLIGLPFHYSHNPFQGMSSVMGHRGVQHGLPKLETNGLGYDPGLRTAPPNAIFRHDFMDNLFAAPTIDPQALHVGMESPQSIGVDPLSPAFHGLPDLSSQATHYGLEDFLITDFGQQLTFNNNMNENAVDGSSSSAISTASPGGMSDAMIDGSNNPATTAPGTTSTWAPGIVSPQMGNPFNIDFQNHVFPDLMSGAPVSPHPMQHGMLNDAYFTPPPSTMNSGSPSVMSSLNAQNMNQTLNFGHGPETPTSINGSTHGTSPVSTITDSTRNAILGALSTASMGSTLANRRSSFSVHPTTSGAHAKGSPDPASTLPNTQSLQRYVAAYLTYFHPHLPFLHIATLSFEIPARPAKKDSGSIGGSACLVLSMAAIGALYEKEHDRARELFEMAKKMIQTYLEQRRKANVRKAGFRGTSSEQDAQEFQDNSTDTPVWLVQSMLLNVVYGHSCGDQLVGKIAETHCAALVSLAQGADLLRQPPNHAEQDIQMSDVSDEHAEWIRWKALEERKRTLYTIFILSSLLVSAYNHSPALTNSEILLELPCDEEFFEAETSAIFHARGGISGANHNRITFHDALGDLLRTNEKQRRLSMSSGHVFNSDDLPPTTLKPSTFGCLILINALHNYIWETRQRHHSNVWTNEETEKMHRHIEPALKAWHAAWASNPHHSAKRPNPFGKGPLSADCIPLLDLAYVRLFVNLSRSKGQFWERDWDGMAEELARGSEIVQHAEQSFPGSEPAVADSLDHMDTTGAAAGLLDNSGQSNMQPSLASRTTSRREKHLRKAAYFAADSLSASDKMDVTFADMTRRDLPPQSALCAFDCAQVLAEWVATLQDRVGQYLGILGQDEVELFQVPAIMLLEEEDVQLLRKVQDVLDGLEKKMGMEFLRGVAGGYAVKILRATAHIMAKSTAWPVSRLMIQCLETHANHTKARVDRSVRPTE